MPTSEHWLHTDEHEEAVSALKTVAEWSGQIEGDILLWRWLTVALHNTIQGFMVLALRGSDGFLPLKDNVASQWLSAYREGGDYPVEKLDSFLNLYKKVKSKKMLYFIHSKRVVATDTQDRSVKKLNAIRNEFIHFLPRSWSLEVSGLPKICLDCLALVEFLAWESGNIIWHKERHNERVGLAIYKSKNNFQNLEQFYGTSL